MKRTSLLVAAGLLMGLATTDVAFAADHEVKMLNRGEAGMMVFEPSHLKIAPGDTVTFVPTDKSHNAESIPGMAPEGSEAFKGDLNKPVTVTFEAEGIYGYRCKPHFAMGMVGVVEVGAGAGNLAAAQAVKLPGKAKKVMAGLLGQVEVAAAK